MVTLHISERAAEIIRKVQGQCRGDLTITIDGGCCEGTAPHLYDNYLVPHGSHQIGRAEGVSVYVPPGFKDQYEVATVTIDLIEEPLSDAMSLETAYGVRLVLRNG